MINKVIIEVLFPFPETPLTKCDYLSKELGINIYLKREDQSAIGSFKLRGAYNNCYNSQKKDVWTASAGNHAQGVAYVMKLLNGTATIVMPRTVLQINWTAF